MNRPGNEDGYELWLRYRRVTDADLLARYRKQISALVVLDGGAAARSPTLQAAVAELQRGLAGLLGRDIPLSSDPQQPGALILALAHSAGLEDFPLTRSVRGEAAASAASSRAGSVPAGGAAAAATAGAAAAPAAAGGAAAAAAGGATGSAPAGAAPAGGEAAAGSAAAGAAAASAPATSAPAASAPAASAPATSAAAASAPAAGATSAGTTPSTPAAGAPAGAPSPSRVPATRALGTSLAPLLAREAFAVLSSSSGPARTAILGGSEIGILYGAFQFLRLLQMGSEVAALRYISAPRLGLRVLNHWDNLDRTVERGYAGFSLWDWQKLPDYLDPRYTDYARACASIGINGTVLTNVNANALVLTDAYLDKVAALAQVFRPYGIRVYLTARFSAPIELDGLPTADPRDPDVRDWWRRRVDGIYRKIPDFGGFVVKANSEGQPGPQNYGRSHADGANLLADALAEHGGVLMWRAFVYDHQVPVDRAKQAYDEFVPLDGSFRSNVLIQVKNGPIDFMPREPHHPLFGAMPKTPLMLELQLTQEYLGCATHLAYLAPLFKECLDTDTGATGPGSTVAKVIDGSLHGHELTGMCAVANIGNDRNWCGHPFAAANWYAFGRLCWDASFSARQLAEEWLCMTFSNESSFVEPAAEMMLASREAVVDYMNPLGLHHQMAVGHHYGPGPWVSEGRPDWTSVYYHRADAQGIGFDRSPSGSNAVEQYFEPLRSQYAKLETCPEELLLWFHHVPWDHQLSSGRTLWEELCQRYQRGVDGVRQFQATWASLAEWVDAARFAHVTDFLRIQEREARWWRDACVQYFQTFSQRPVPDGYEAPEKSLEELRALRHYYVPGIHNPFVPRTPANKNGPRSENRK